MSPLRGFGFLRRGTTNMLRLWRWQNGNVAGHVVLTDCGVVIVAKVSLIGGMKKSAVVVDRAIMGGEACFAGTRVPVRALLDYLEGGNTIGEFLAQHPAASRAQVVGLLERASALGCDLDKTARADLRAARRDWRQGKSDAFVTLSKL
jgi:uncharacterized protein (DUF433 family)